MKFDEHFIKEQTGHPAILYYLDLSIINAYQDLHKSVCLLLAVNIAIA
jgi:hypothetical protein